MKISTRAVLATLAIMLCFAGFILACPRWIRDMGLDVWSVAGHRQVLRDGKANLTCRDDELRALRQLISLKSVVVKNVIDGRITLLEAADQFLELNQYNPGVYRQMRNRFESGSDAECAALQVIAHVRVQTRDDSPRSLERIRDLVPVQWLHRRLLGPANPNRLRRRIGRSRQHPPRGFRNALRPTSQHQLRCFRRTTHQRRLA